jgi:hypothetical protein
MIISLEVGILMISDLSKRKGGWVRKNEIVNGGTSHDAMAL